MNKFFWVVSLCIFLSSFCFGEVDLRLDTKQYLTGDLFTNPVLPNVGQPVKITARVKANIAKPKNLFVVFQITSQKSGASVLKRKVQMVKTSQGYEGKIVWNPQANGFYDVTVTLDPDNRITESDENNNISTILLPVIAKGRKLYFVSWTEDIGHKKNTRWLNCITYTHPEEAFNRLAERGVLPLNGSLGGASMRYDAVRDEKDPSEYRKSFIASCYSRYSKPCQYGYGLDEVGGYPNTGRRKNSIYSLEAVAKVKKEKPNRFFAVWHGGAVDEDMIRYSRAYCDLVLWETYYWRAIPMELGINDIYPILKQRLEAFKKYDMLVPAYGNKCRTLIALDACERPDLMSRGEIEQIIRFIRRHCPAMRGLAWYNGGVRHTDYGIKKWEKKHYDKMYQIFAWVDELAFEYYIKPVITFQQQSLWLDRDSQGRRVLVAAVNNIGGVDSGPVELKFYVDGKSVATKTIESVPAGANRNENLSLVQVELKDISSGKHLFKAEIVSAKESTVLDGTTLEERFIND